MASCEQAHQITTLIYHHPRPPAYLGSRLLLGRPPLQQPRLLRHSLAASSSHASSSHASSAGLPVEAAVQLAGAHSSSAHSVSAVALAPCRGGLRRGALGHCPVGRRLPVLAHVHHGVLPAVQQRLCRHLHWGLVAVVLQAGRGHALSGRGSFKSGPTGRQRVRWDAGSSLQALTASSVHGTTPDCRLASTSTSKPHAVQQAAHLLCSVLHQWRQRACATTLGQL